MRPQLRLSVFVLAVWILSAAMACSSDGDKTATPAPQSSSVPATETPAEAATASPVSTATEPFIGQLNGFTFYDPGNFDHAAYMNSWSPKCRSVAGGSNIRDVSGEEGRASRLNFTTAYLPIGAMEHQALASACEDDIFLFTVTYTVPAGSLQITRRAGMAAIAAAVPRQWIEERQVAGKPAVAVLPRGVVTALYLLDSVGIWHIGARGLDLNELVKIAEGLK